MSTNWKKFCGSSKTTHHKTNNFLVRLPPFPKISHRPAMPTFNRKPSAGTRVRPSLLLPYTATTKHEVNSYQNYITQRVSLPKAAVTTTFPKENCELPDSQN